jgi:hypothetical protein
MTTIDRQAIIDALSRLVTPGIDPEGFPMTPLWEMARQSRSIHDWRPRVASRGPAPASSVLVNLVFSENS